ncbi:MAG: UDP-N-acetylmuramoyl-tripeptide--D-alanyl-D-alanine ligase [Cyanobacteria bacterium P01_H01_bin.119]
MVFQATLAQVAAAIAAKPFHLPPKILNKTVSGISTDTRTLKPGQIFLALKGDSFDGHQFLSIARDRGATAAIVSAPKGVPDGFPYLQVGDTLHAYQQLAHWWRNHLGLPIVAITGSVGKTTTKELIAAALGTQGRILKTEANHNNEIGVPKTLLTLTPDHSYGIIEMGMRGPGEIALLSQIAAPTVGVITNVGTAHIGRLGSEQAIAEAKCELLAEMPAGSTAVLNADNARLMKTAATVWQGRQLTFGLSSGDICGQYHDAPDGASLTLEGLSIPLPLPGEHNALNYLAAIAVMQTLNLDWTVLAQGLTVTLPPGRAKRLELPNDIVVLDETYNAGFESMVAALKLLATLPGERRIAVLGTMKELGSQSQRLHHCVGETAAQLGIHQLLVLAEPVEADALQTGAAGIPSTAFASRAQLGAALQQMVKPGDRVLFKASHSVGLNQVVTEFAQSLLPLAD